MTATLVWSIIGAVLLGLITLAGIIFIIFCFIACADGGAEVLIVVPLAMLTTIPGIFCYECAKNAYDTHTEIQARKVYDPMTINERYEILSYYDNYLSEHYEVETDKAFTLVRVAKDEFRIYLNEENFATLKGMTLSRDSGIKFEEEKLIDYTTRNFITAKMDEKNIHGTENENPYVTIEKLPFEESNTRKLDINVYVPENYKIK